ncbi:hypothetical protein BOW53_15370 [Solemya pervernicosa gill symbiont]|uniref:Uncharacterized protein n=1 Tax=Solemya pervernicosa gill symbiont TaxID=642797 RepID=A0A1T2L064_9GAMM|nr:DUF2799 domain-containing protein [Solemya pervernicosa gill symbiont]OOZ38495.1 hypothetical protein BOW53_15370 [Solemya pervernicosa gill symbiont]
MSKELIIFLCLFAQGCSTPLTKEKCDATNWLDKGRSAAFSGMEREQGKDDMDECSSFGSKIDSPGFDAGYQAGLLEYCTTELAYQYGYIGRNFNPDICPSSESKITIAHYAGRLSAINLSMKSLLFQLININERLANTTKPTWSRDKLIRKIEAIERGLVDINVKLAVAASFGKYFSPVTHKEHFIPYNAFRTSHITDNVQHILHHIKQASADLESRTPSPDIEMDTIKIFLKMEKILRQTHENLTAITRLPPLTDMSGAG